MAEDATNSALLVDRGLPVANDLDADGRRKLRVGSGDLALQVDDHTSFLYLGQAAPGTLTSASKWQIVKFIFSGTLIESQYPNGDAGYTNVWDDRASLTYV
jgi:hypothetical protein